MRRRFACFERDEKGVKYGVTEWWGLDARCFVLHNGRACLRHCLGSGYTFVSLSRELAQLFAETTSSKELGTNDFEVI